MNLFRGIVAVVSFIAGLFFTVTFFISNHDGFIAVLAISMFLLAYVMWPSRKRKDRDDDYWWVDVIEIVIELPFHILNWLFRSIIRFFKDSDGRTDL